MNYKIVIAAVIMVLMAGTFVVLSDESDAIDVDTSMFAGDYYAQKDDGTWFKALSIDSDGSGVAYKAYPNDTDTRPVGSTQENFTITEINETDTTYTLSATRDFNNKPQPIQFTYYKIPGSTMYDTLHCNHKSLVGTDDRAVESFTRAAPEGVAWFGYTSSEGPNFTPYYVTDAVNIGEGDVVITLPEGTYEFSLNKIQFPGKSLTIRAAEGAEVHITTFTFNASTGNNGATIALENLIFDGMTGSGEGEEKVNIVGFSDITIEGCTIVDRLLTPSNTTSTPGTITIRNCTLINENITADRYAVTTCNTNIILDGNFIDGYARGVNLQGKGTGYGSIVATGNTIQNTTTVNEGAIQVADGLDGMSIVISNNTIKDCKAAVAVHDGIKGTPESFEVTENLITGTDVGILYKTEAGEGRTNIPVHADANYFSPDGGQGQPLAVYVQDIGRDDSLIQEDSYYVDSDMDTTDDDVLPPSWDDEDDLPPFIPTQPADDDDTVTIVACAAAAAVAAILAVFLVIDRKG